MRDNIRYHEHRYYVLDDPEVSRLYLGEEAGRDITGHTQNGERNS